MKLAKQKKTPDRNLFILILVFVFLGLTAVADASAPQALAAYGDKFFFLKQQLIWAGGGLVALLVFSRIHYSFWGRIAKPLFFVSLGLLILVLVPQFSLHALGARRWLVFGSLNFQPSEVIKLALTIYLAKVAEKSKGILSYFIPLALVVGLVMFQPDLGTAIVISVIAFMQIFVSGASLVYFALGGIVASLVALGLILISPYRKDRLLTFFEMTRDPLGKSYHIRQVLIALGSGGLFGVGLGASRQKYLFLPEAATDSIFAVITEELGLIGGAVLIGLFVYFAILGLRIAGRAPDKFSQVLAVGIVAWIWGQTFLNLASMVALVPLTGIPLPFFSYGGSSLVMVLVAVVILLNISTHTVSPVKPIRRHK